MSIEQDVLVALLAHDEFHNQDPMVSGIAQRAIDFGLEQLSERQQAVLKPFLTKACEGVEDPGGYHNNCQYALEGQDLVDAINNSGYYGSTLCVDCREEQDGYTNEWERIKAE